MCVPQLVVPNEIGNENTQARCTSTDVFNQSLITVHESSMLDCL